MDVAQEQNLIAVLKGHNLASALERNCAASQSQQCEKRKALENLNPEVRGALLRLVLRTQPRSRKWCEVAPVFKGQRPDDIPAWGNAPGYAVRHIRAESPFHYRTSTDWGGLSALHLVWSPVPGAMPQAGMKRAFGAKAATTSSRLEEFFATFTQGSSFLASASARAMGFGT